MTVTGNTLWQGYRHNMLLEDCRRIHLSDSTVLDCDTCGVWLKNVSQSYVHDLFVRDDRPGSTSLSLRQTAGDRLTLRNNVLQHPPQETGVSQP